MKARFFAPFASAIVLSLAAPLQAAILTWNGSTTGGAAGTSDTWDTVTANWTGDVTIWPAASTGDDDAVFGGTAGTVTISGGVTANSLTFNTTGYTISSSTLTLDGTTPTISTPAANLNATISSVIAGTAGLTKAGLDNTGLVTLSGNNTFTGTVSLNSGALRITNSSSLGTGAKTINLNGGGGSAAFLELRLDPGANGSITLPSNMGFSTATNSGNGIRNKSGNNEIKGNFNVRSGLGSTAIGSDAGTLTLSGTISAGASNRVLYLNGNSTSFNTVKGAINNGSGLALNKGGNGLWILTGNNGFANGTTVASGKLLVTSATGLGTGNVAVSANANLSYAAATDSPLAIGGNLTVTGGTSTTIGCAIGSTATSASINVTGDATITDAAHTVDLYGVPGTNATTGTYTLISGTGGGSALNPTTEPTLGKVYNNSNFTVGGFTRSASALQVGITAATPLANAYWVGGFSGGTNVWALSDGTSESNWAATIDGATQELVPGASTNVIIAGTSPIEAPTATVLGASMTINGLTISDTVNGLGLNDDGNTLTIQAGGLTMDADVPASSIAAKVALAADQTWTINSGNALTASGIISGPSAITKAGSGTLALAAANTYTGATQVAAGTLSLANVSALASSELVRAATDTGVISYDVVGATTYNIGALSGDGALDAGGKTLSIGAKNSSTEFSGALSNGALTKVGSGTLTLSGASTFAGAVNVNAGRLTLANSGALGTGPKTVVMEGTNRTIYLTNSITIPSDITFSLSSNSGDGNGLNNESGDNEIQGNINVSFGNPILSIASDADSLKISGNVTLTATGRPVTFGGDSEADNTVSGNISENSAAIMPVTKQGAGKWIFSGTNTYKGDTTVSAGTLVLASGGSQAFYPKAAGTSNKITGTGTGTITLNGALAIDLANANTATEWLLVDVTNLAETYGTNFTVTDFTETPTDSGIWKRTVGSNAYTFTEGDGKLVRGPAAPAGFTSWIATPAFGLAVGDQDPTDDPDNDGIENLVEYVLNGAPNASDQNILPKLNASGANFVFTFTRQASSAGDSTQIFQYGSDLIGWTDVAVVNGGVVAITPDTPGAGLDQVIITVAKGANTKLFGRLKVTKP